MNTKSIGRKPHESSQKTGEKRIEGPAVPLSCIDVMYCGADSREKVPVLEARGKVFRELLACKCKSQWCRDCATGHMVDWRHRLRPVIKGWGRVCMVTLTIDRTKWNGPQEAYEAIQKKRAVSEFVRKLIRRGLLDGPEFFYAIEFHKAGWTHWHLAVRAKRITKGRWGSKEHFASKDQIAKLWGHGFVHDQATPDGMSPDHAMHYLTKYISKQDVGPPIWVLDYTRNFRKFSTSHGLCAKPRKRSRATGTTKGKRATPREVLAKCCRKTTHLEVTQVDELYMGGTRTRKQYKHLGTYDETIAQIACDEKRVKSLLTVPGQDRLGDRIASRSEARNESAPPTLPVRNQDRQGPLGDLYANHAPIMEGGVERTNACTEKRTLDKADAG